MGKYDTSVGGLLQVGGKDIKKWTELGKNVSRNVSIQLPSDFYELYIEVVITNSSDLTDNIVDFNIPREALSTTEKGYRKGFYFLSGYNGSAQIKVSTTSAKLVDAYLNGSYNPSNSYSKISVYYR